MNRLRKKARAKKSRETVPLRDMSSTLQNNYIAFLDAFMYSVLFGFSYFLFQRICFLKCFFVMSLHIGNIVQNQFPFQYIFLLLKHDW